jgi:hypothetical protein
MNGLGLNNSGRNYFSWRTILRYAGAGVVAILVTACGSGNPEAIVAKNVVDQFYRARIQKDDVKTAQFYSSNHSSEDRKDYLERIFKELGKVKSYHIKREEINTVLRGRFYIYDVQVEYAPAGIAAETVTVFNEVGSKETKIVAHNINMGKVALTL